MIGCGLPSSLSPILESRLLRDILLQFGDPLLQSPLIVQKLSIDLHHSHLTSDKLGICDALISKPFSADELIAISGLCLAEGGRMVFMGLNYLLFFCE